MIAQLAVVVALSRPSVAVRQGAMPAAPFVVCEVRGGERGVPVERACLWLPSVRA